MSSNASTSSLGTISPPWGKGTNTSRRPARLAKRRPSAKPRPASVVTATKLPARGRAGGVSAGASLGAGAGVGATTRGGAGGVGARGAAVAAGHAVVRKQRTVNVRTDQDIPSSPVDLQFGLRGRRERREHAFEP